MEDYNIKKEDVTILELEDSLLENLNQSYSHEDGSSIVYDGLCWKAIIDAKPDKANRNWPECLWTDSERRVLFLLKEPNGNPNEDYKDWDWSERRETFGNILAYWLEGILSTTAEKRPSYDNLSSRKEIFRKCPLALVNLKKLSGGSSANWNTIWRYAQKDQETLRKQIRGILNPNIIVCGGSNDVNDDYRKVITIALELIFPDIKEGFKKINNWCYYNSNEDIVLIDSYHPSFPMKNRDKVERLINNFQDFILKTNYQH